MVGLGFAVGEGVYFAEQVWAAVGATQDTLEIGEIHIQRGGSIWQRVALSRQGERRRRGRQTEAAAEGGFQIEDCVAGGHGG
jgi:hypothetical protein